MDHGFVPNVWFGLDPMVVSTAVLVMTYAVVIWDKLNRAIVALLGAAVMILVGALDQHEALKGVDWNTIGLLTGMMILVSISRRSGMFQYLAIWAAKKAKAHPGGILILLQITTAVLSAFLDNVTTVLLVVPVTIAIVRELDVPAYPYLFAEVFASNIGGTATLIGDPPNILIGSLAGLDFNAFVVHLAPVIVVVMAAQLVMIHLLWGRELKSTPARQALVMGMDERSAIEDPVLLEQSLAVLGIVIVGFVLARPLHLEPATIAMGGAAVLMLLDNWQHHAERQSENVHKTFGDVEWITIFFFVGLFIVVHGVEVGGLLALLANKLVAATGGDMATAGYAILWASAVLSAIVDNIPFVATMIPLIKSMAPAYGGPDAILPLWWCLSLGACLGGNGTLIGASANLTVAGIADRNGVPFRFVTYTLYAFPMMLVSIAIAHVYVWLRYF
ncbi:MAG: ArsB/NhaD family transporter [Rhodoplanes sp.]|uniref:SLC13 family permease n=1 Tax=Rhodoplanes sp. TaxID=1968906 RepID=UPI001795D847|nr:ArsB/NhaD family transporter [Rhodoplanes sp.]NVO17567.1 ArsB/NhaD family transporter [Rhodoplanes sp.]